MIGGFLFSPDHVLVRGRLRQHQFLQKYYQLDVTEVEFAPKSC